MVSRPNIILVSLSVCALIVASGPAAASDSYHQAIWQLEHDFVSWAELEETGVRRGIAVDSRGRSREDFLQRLLGLESHVERLDGTKREVLLRKVEMVRTRIQHWPGAEVASQSGGVTARYPGTSKPDSVRPVLPTAECADAEHLSLETVFWATTDYLVRDSARLAAWFEIAGVDPGWYRIHTMGSAIDTVVTVTSGCAGEVVVSNDDEFGLQSSLVVRIYSDQPVLVFVEAASSKGQQQVFLTLEPTGSGAISGQLRDESTLEPIEWERVRLYDGDGYYTDSEHTNDSGLYHFEGLETGVYFVATSGIDDYLDELWDNIPCEFDCEPTLGDPIAVDQDLVSGINFDLSRGASISGTVVNLDGVLVTEGRIELYDGSGQHLDNVSLDDLGRYQFLALTAGIYLVATDLEEHEDEVWDDVPCVGFCDPLSGTPIALQDREIATGFDFEVRKLGTISGQLTDFLSGLPIVNGRVQVRSASGYSSDYPQSDALGYWKSDGLPPGTYFVATDFYSHYRDEVYDNIPCDPYCDYESGTPIALEVEQEVVGIDFELDPLGAITGTMVDEVTGAPVPSVQVQAWRGGLGQVESSSSSVLGRYELTDLHPGTYFVVTDELGPYVDELFDDIACFGGTPLGCDPFSGTPIPIDIAVVRDDIDFDLSRGANLAGQVTDLSTGESLYRADINLFAQSGALLRSTDTDQGGLYSLQGLAAGRYFLGTETQTHFDELYDGFDCEGGCNPVTGTPVMVQLGESILDLDFQLALQGGVSGVVENAQSEPLQGIRLHAWDSSREEVTVGVTDTNGFYQLDLSSGFFYLSTDAPLGYGNQLWNGISCTSGSAIDGLCDPARGDQITVTGADPVQTGFDFVLQEVLFSDGFESQDLLRWSDAVN